jgi:basic membrane lipoprotein Med (substrate-binding protein (PBP1-ABC) superfamily)
MKKNNLTHFIFQNVWILLFILFFTSCSIEFHSSEKVLSIGYCVDVLGIENESYHHPMVQYLENVEKKGELQLHLRSSNKKEDYKRHIQALAQNSPLMKEDCIECSFQYPETQFVLYDSYPFQMEKMVLPDRENLSFLFFSDEEIATIAGFIAAHISTTESAALYFPGSRNSPLKNRIYNHYVEGFRLASSDSENIIFLAYTTLLWLMKQLPWQKKLHFPAGVCLYLAENRGITIIMRGLFAKTIQVLLNTFLNSTKTKWVN